MFASRSGGRGLPRRGLLARTILLALAVLVVWALLARDSGATGEAGSYRVRAGDTLWSIAVEMYGGDPREGVWRIERRNGLETSTIRPGQVLVIP